VLIPFGIPVYSFPYLDSVFKYSLKEKKNGKDVLPVQEYNAKEKCKTMMHQLQSVYDSLPENEKKNCLTWGKQYSQAGAVELFKDEYGLPNAFSYHGSFYTRAPAHDMPETAIAFCYNDADDDFFNPFFEEVTPVRKIYSDYASNEGWVVQTIFICHKPKQSFDKMKEFFKKRIFE